MTNEQEERCGRVDVMRQPGQALNRDIAKGESVEAEINAFISRRHEQRRKSEPERETEAAWRAAEKLQEAARRRENRAGWCSWHLDRASLYARLSVEHEAEAERLQATERRTA